MPSTYTLNNGITLIASGEGSGTWGDTTNVNLSLLDTALDGQVSITLSSAGSSGSPNDLPISDGSASNGRNRLVIFADGSDLGATAYVRLTPNDSEKIIYVRNALSGSRSILLFQGTYNASNDYELPAGSTAVIYFNGGGSGAVAANVFNNAYFDGLRLGSVSVTSILDEDNMSSNSATALSTQQSIKAYVDAQVATADTLAEVLAIGNTSGGTNLVVSSGDVITTNTVSETSSGSGVTVDSLLIKDGGITAAGTSTFAGQTISNLGSVTTADINGGTIDAVVIGGASAAAATVTSLTATGLTLGGTAVTSTAAELNILDGVTSTTAELNILDGVTSTTAELNILDGVTSTASELNILDGATVVTSEINALDIGSTAIGTAVASKAVILDSNKDYTGIRNLTLTGALTLGTDLSVANGGTGASTLTANGILYGAGTGAVAATDVGTDGHVLTSNGSGNAPTFQAASGGATDIDGLSDAVTWNSGQQIGLGSGALVSNTSSNGANTAVGYTAGNAVTSGQASTFFGNSAGSQMTTGASNNFIGRSSGHHITTTSNNNFMGAFAGYSVTGANNVAVGTNSMLGGWSGGASTDKCVAIGTNSMYATSTGEDTVAIGYDSLKAMTTGSVNVAIGAGSGIKLTSGYGNTLIGESAGTDITTGNKNIMIGRYTGHTGSNFTGSNNIVIGYFADASSQSVSHEITLGDTTNDKFRVPGVNFIVKYSTATTGYVLTADANGEAGWAAAAGGATDIDGLSDGVTNSSGGTVGLGTSALGNDDGSANQNTALGYQALGTTNSNFQNTAVGYRAGYALTGTGDINYGRDSSLFGANAGVALTTGRANTAFGMGALDGATTPDNNAAFGKEAGGSVTTGANNVFVGSDAGYTTTTGSNNIILGKAAEASSATVSNEITLGPSSISALRCQVTSISSLSDRRDKKDIKDLSVGLDFVNSLNPVEFTWNMRDGAKVGQKEAGFIAQELDEAQQDAGVEDLMNLVLKINPDKLEAAPGKLIPVLVKAIQELSSEIQTLKGQIND